MYGWNFFICMWKRPKYRWVICFWAKPSKLKQRHQHESISAQQKWVAVFFFFTLSLKASHSLKTTMEKRFIIITFIMSALLCVPSSSSKALSKTWTGYATALFTLHDSPEASPNPTQRPCFHLRLTVWKPLSAPSVEFNETWFCCKLYLCTHWFLFGFLGVYF